MSKSKPYSTCPDCGDNLDHGEHCDCKDKEPGEQKAADRRGLVLVRVHAMRRAKSAG